MWGLELTGEVIVGTGFRVGVAVAAGRTASA